MAGRKDAAGRRRARPLGAARPSPVFIVHDLKSAIAALAVARAARQSITLRTPPGAIHAHGLGYLTALFALARERFPRARFTAVIDCDNDAAQAHRALTLGMKEVAFRGHKKAREALESVAEQLGAELLPGGIPRGACRLDDPESAHEIARAHLEKCGRLAKPKRPG